MGLVHCLVLLLASSSLTADLYKPANSPPPSITLSNIRVDNSKAHHPFVDEDGRERIFHGINRVEKGAPWYPAVLLNSTRIDEMLSWGFNVVRLGTMWSGVEIGPFQVNQTYLDIMDRIVQMLSSRGVYVILDLHQDGLSTKFHNYDGVPLWLINSFPTPSEPFPWPFSAPPSNWELNYVTYACGEAFKDIYTNQSRALDHLGFFWQTVAKRFGHYKNVLGYELMNEPFPGNVFTDPLLFLPGKAGSQLLMPMYDKLVPFIRAVDQSSMIFYEPVTWGMIENGDDLGTGFTHVPGGDNQRNHSVLSFHYYCWFAGVHDKNPFPGWLRELCDNLFFPDVVETIYKDVTDTGGGLFLTEFGNCQATAAKNSTEYQECLSVLNTSDTNRLSWSYWDSVFYNPDGSAWLENVRLFSRTYAMAIAGEPVMSAYDSVHGAYTLSYLPLKACSKPTVIYTSTVNYPKGFTVNVTNGNYTITNDIYVEVKAVNYMQLVKVIITAN